MAREEVSWCDSRSFQEELADNADSMMLTRVFQQNIGYPVAGA